MEKVILCCFLLYSLVHVSFQNIVEVNHAANFTIEPRAACQCGIKSSSRIVGGSNADKNEYPWMVALCLGPTCSYRSQFCGATLLTEDYIVTAAHCIQGMRAPQLSVSVGDYNMNSESETNNQVYKIQRIIKHKGYRPSTVVNDIALLKVKGKVKLNDNVIPACLPKSKAQYANKIATATGWGTTSAGGKSSAILKEVQVRVLDNDKCKNRYGEEFRAGMLCAGSKNRDSCQGDSGGPLVLKNNQNKWELIGVVSWGYGCGSPGYPGVYTRARYYLKWIEDRIGKNAQCSA